MQWQKQINFYDSFFSLYTNVQTCLKACMPYKEEQFIKSQTVKIDDDVVLSIIHTLFWSSGKS